MNHLPMSEHLPECPRSSKCECVWMDTCENCGCVCDALRACEQRVRKSLWQECYDAAMQTTERNYVWHEKRGYAAALRDAMQAIPHAAFCLAHGMSNADDLDCDCGRTDAVAAIRALKGER